MSSDPTNTTPPIPSDPAADKAFIDSVIALKDPIRAAWTAGVKAGIVKWSRTQWLTLGGAVLAAVLATFGATSAMKQTDPAPAPTPVPVPVTPSADVGKVIADGFAEQSKLLQANTQAIIKAIEFKPFVPPLPVAKGAIPSEITAKVGRLVTIKSSEAVDQWIIPPGSPCEWDVEGRKLTIVPTEAVEFSIGVVTQKGKSLAWCLVKAGLGPKPPPKPDPTPDPKPDPKPNPKLDSLYVVAIWESTDSTPAIAKVMKDLGFWIALEQMGCQWFQIDKDQKDGKGTPLIDVHGYRQHMDKVGLPCLIFMDRTGNVLDVTRMPDTTAKIREQVKSFMGK